MSKFERKFGKYAISNLSTLLLMCYGVGYAIQFINNSFLNYLTLDPYQILHGQVWRLFTWIVVPPSMGGLLGTLIMLYFYWSIGMTLERTWGTYRFNVYIFSGMLFTVLGSFIAMGLAYVFYRESWYFADPFITSQVFGFGATFFSTEYINLSIFLAFAATFPEVQVLLMFIVPIKVKWLGVVYAIIAGWEFFEGRVYMLGGGTLTLDMSLFVRMAIAASLLNFVVFFFTSRKHMMRSPKEIKRQHEFKREVHRASVVTRHKCAICGRTDETNPELEFRFCSKCNGNYEYCQDHLFTHEHVK